MAFTHLIFFVFACAFVQASTISYNTSVDCSSTPCNLVDPTIWVGGIVPSVNDTANIQGNANTTSYFITNTWLILQNLFIQNVVLDINQNYTQVQNFTAVNSNVTIHTGTGLSVYQNLYIYGASNVTVQASGRFVNALRPPLPVVFLDSPATFAVNGLVSLYTSNASIHGAVDLAASGSISILGFCVFSPRTASLNALITFLYAQIPDNYDIVFSQGAYFGNLSIGANSNVTMFSQVNIYNTLDDTFLYIGTNSILNLVNMTVGPTQGYMIGMPFGDGVVNIYNSEAYLRGPKTPVSWNRGALKFYGNNTAWFYYAYVDNLSFSSDAQIFMYPSSSTFVNTASTPLYIPGNVEASFSYLNFSGPFSFSGGLWAEAAQIYVNGDLSFGNVVTLGGYTVVGNAAIPSSWNSTGNFLTTPMLSLYNDSYVTVQSNLQINGNLNNVNGDVRISPGAALFVNGVFAQSGGANLTLYGLDTSFTNPVDTSSSRITVQAGAEIAGNVLYTYSKLAKKTKYAILQVLNGTINGTFSANKATAIYGSIKSVSLDYTTPNIVYAVYNSGTGKAGPLMWYYWVAIGVGALLVIIVIACLVRRSARKGYDKV